MQDGARQLTRASGRPYVENDTTLTVGPRGPILLQDYILHEKMAHFNRERIPERDEIIARQLCHFFRADVQLGLGVAAGLGVDVEALMPQQECRV